MKRLCGSTPPSVCGSPLGGHELLSDRTQNGVTWACSSFTCGLHVGVIVRTPTSVVVSRVLCAVVTMIEAAW